jgi:GntR family transcriptional regulator
LAVRERAGLPEGAKARRVYLLLRDEMSNGTYPEGSTLPAEQRLAVMFAVSRVTIRRALDALDADGLIEKRVGSGTVVRPQQGAGETLSADFTTLLPQLVQMGQATTARLLSFSYGAAPEGVSSAMALPRGSRVQTAVRVRLIEGRPFSHLTTYVPEEIAASYTEADLATTPLFRLLERSGVRVTAAHQSVSAVLAAPDVAEALDIAAGAALLSLKRVVRDEEGRGVEYLSALYRADIFRLEMDLNRVGFADARHWEPVIGDPAAQQAAQ